MRQLASLHHQVLTPAQAENFAVVLRTLGDPSRLRILSLLAQNGPMRGVDIEPLVHLTQPVVSHHLQKLRREGFVTRRVEAHRMVWYALAPEALDYVASFLAVPR